MFRSKAAESVIALPEPPSVEAFLEVLKVAGPDDIVFTLDLSDPLQLVGLPELPKRFKVCHIGVELSAVVELKLKRGKTQVCMHGSYLGFGPGFQSN